MSAWWKGFNTQLSAPRLDSVTNHQDLPGVKTGLSKQQCQSHSSFLKSPDEPPGILRPQRSNNYMFGIKKREKKVGGKNRNKVYSQLVVLLVSSPSSGAFKVGALALWFCRSLKGNLMVMETDSLSSCHATFATLNPC